MPVTTWITATRTVSTPGLSLTTLTATWAPGFCVAGSDSLTPCSPTPYITIKLTEQLTDPTEGASFALTTAAVVTDRGVYCVLAPSARGCQQFRNVSSTVDSFIESKKDDKKWTIIVGTLLVLFVGVPAAIVGMLLCQLILSAIGRSIQKMPEMRKQQARTSPSTNEKAADESVVADTLMELPRAHYPSLLHSAQMPPASFGIDAVSHSPRTPLRTTIADQPPILPWTWSHSGSRSISIAPQSSRTSITPSQRPLSSSIYIPPPIYNLVGIVEHDSRPENYRLVG